MWTNCKTRKTCKEKSGYTFVFDRECYGLSACKKMREEPEAEVIEPPKPRNVFLGDRTDASKLKVLKINLFINRRDQSVSNCDVL